MADGTKIEWTDATWNPITGCNVVSPGCTNCYAMKLAGGRLRHHPSRVGLTEASKSGPVWNGKVRLNADWLDQPLRWAKPRRVFVCAHGDLFHEFVPDEWIDGVFAVMALAPQPHPVSRRQCRRRCRRGAPHAHLGVPAAGAPIRPPRGQGPGAKGGALIAHRAAPSHGLGRRPALRAGDRRPCLTLCFRS